MTDKAKYLVCNILDYAFTYGGTASVIIYNYVSPANSMPFKISFTGIILEVAMIFFMKASFEKHYREKHDNLLQQLAEATDPEAKKKISEKINEHKIKNNIYQRLMLLLPFIVLFVVSWFGQVMLSSLRGTVGLILISLSAGSVMNVIKKPIKEKIDLAKITK
jgi:hypothetical protein